MTNKIDPNKYRSQFESSMEESKRPVYARMKRQEGADMAGEGLIMHVSATGLWWATSDDKLRLIESYERIGYHTLAEQLLVGFLGAGGTCYFHEFDGIEGPVELAPTP